MFGVDCRKLHLINDFKHKLSARGKDGALSTAGAFRLTHTMHNQQIPSLCPCPHPGVLCLIVKCFTAWFGLLPGKNTSLAPTQELFIAGVLRRQCDNFRKQGIAKSSCREQQINPSPHTPVGATHAQSPRSWRELVPSDFMKEMLLRINKDSLRFLHKILS